MLYHRAALLQKADNGVFRSTGRKEKRNPTCRSRPTRLLHESIASPISPPAFRLESVDPSSVFQRALLVPARHQPQELFPVTVAEPAVKDSTGELHGVPHLLSFGTGRSSHTAVGFCTNCRCLRTSNALLPRLSVHGDEHERMILVPQQRLRITMA